MEIKEETKLRTPYYLIDEALLKKNLEILKEVSERSGCRILLAQKAFSMFSLYPLLRQYLAGSAASGLYEARLGKEEFGGETHVFSAAYREDEF
ncbi:MAG: carboxynorspermidine decarboxylase, partial [Clostridium sp.]|nr:carboxynorspermidine decarboxylase [Clostridium sp.]